MRKTQSPITALAAILLFILAFTSCLSIENTGENYDRILQESGAGSESIAFEPDPFGNGYINRIKITGNHFDYGKAVGLMSQKTPIRPGKVSNADRKLNDRIAEMYRQFYPPYLETVAGIASAYGIKPEDVDLRDLEWRFFVELGWVSLGFLERDGRPDPQVNAACSIAAYQIPETGETVVARNFDWRMHNGTVVETALDGDFRASGNTIICPENWIMDGINEHGLFIGVMTVATPYTEFIEHQPYPDYPAVDAHHMMKILLNTCRTVAEAEEMVKKVKVYFGSESIHYLLADPDGDMAVFEFDFSGDPTIIRTDNHYLLSTNFKLAGSTLDEQMLCHRYALGSRLLEQEKISSARDLYDLMMRLSPNPQAPLASSPYLPHPEYFTMGVWTSFYNLNDKSGAVRFWLTPEPEFVPLGF